MASILSLIQKNVCKCIVSSPELSNRSNATANIKLTESRFVAKNGFHGSRSYSPSPIPMKNYFFQGRKSDCRKRIIVLSSASASNSDSSPHENSNLENSNLPKPSEIFATGSAEAAIEIEKGKEWHLKKYASAFWVFLAIFFVLFGVFATKQPANWLQVFSKSGFTAAFSLIFVSEIGDKTFFIAALLAMRHSRTMVLLGATSALAIMTVISVVLGKIFNAMPAQLTSDLPIGEWLAVILLVYFGVRSIQQSLPPNFSFSSLFSGSEKKEKEAVGGGKGGEEEEDGGELQEAKEFLDKIELDKFNTPLKVFIEAFSLVFVAEWGDRSMLATVALAVAQNPFGVAGGAIFGHFLATAIAVVGGSFLSEYISERAIGLIGGVLFLLFAIATAFGVF